MELTIFWLVIIGPLILSVAVGAWFVDKKLIAVWTAFAGAVLLLLALAMQMHRKFATEPKAIAENGIEDSARRPYVTVSAIGFPYLGQLQPGILRIQWDIKNGPQEQAKIIEANMTIHFATPVSPLPDIPGYIPAPHKLSGIFINPGDTFNAKFTAVLSPLSKEAVRDINGGQTVLFVFGYVRYAGERQHQSIIRGFIARYNPTNTPATGMFDYYEQNNYTYEHREQAPPK